MKAIFTDTTARHQQIAQSLHDSNLSKDELLGAIDLGSNSFHLAIARLDHGEVRKIASISEKVQLAAGLDENNILSEEAIQRGIDCLRRFSQHISAVDSSRLRIVATNALRKAANANEFIKRANVLLPKPIEVIAGREEARLIYLGVSHSNASTDKRLVVDIGGGTTDIAVLCDTGVVVSESLRIGGDSFNEAIIQYVRRKKKLVIGALTAEETKISAGTVDRRSEEREVEIRGRDAITGLPKIVTLHSLEIQRALESQVMSILEEIKSILEKTPPELVAAIADHGIILTGGGALISGLDRVISRSIGIAAYLVEMPRYAVIKGVAKTLDEMSTLRDTLEELQ